jgi:hypothetical protein
VCYKAEKTEALNMVKKRLVLLLSAMLIASSAHAQLTLEPRTEGGVTYVSGGVGEEELDAMRGMRDSFNLHLTFAAQGSGQYLSDVNVQIVDSKGTVLLDAPSDGPYFFAQLKPGSYKIIAANQGRAITESVTVPTTGAAGIWFHFPGAQ